MTTTRQFAFALPICFSALLVSAQAQTPRINTVNIAAESDKVQITAQGDVSEMRVDVADESGDVVFQSGAITGQQLDWKMTDAQGERVAAGTYLVTVTFRNAAGKLRKRVEQVTVDEAEQSNKQDAASPQAVQETVTTSNPGVFGSIARFTGESTIANSVISQTTAGKIGIGTSAPEAKLEVAGNWTGEDGALRVSGDKPTIRLTGGAITDSRSWIMHLGSNGPGNLEFYRRAGQTWGQVMSLTPAGNVGIGTANPTANLHVRSGEGFTPIKLTAGSGAGASAGTWRIQADNGLSGQGSAFVIYSDTAQQYRMVINGSGNVGIGTSSPIRKLEVRDTTASPLPVIVAINDGLGDGLHAIAKGAAVQGFGKYGVIGDDRSTGTDGIGVFGISDKGKAIYGLSNGGFAGYFKGKLQVDGTFVNNSDRNAKANISSINSRSILQRLMTIPIQAWNYKAEPATIRHVGPMAQDFRAAFGLGVDDKGISGVDADGVALASIQALYQMMREKDKEIQQLRAQVTQQQAQLNQVKRTIKRKRTARR